MQSVRRRITEIIKETGSATVAELAHELGMAQVSVRHHIDILIGENLVQTIGVRRRNGVGRPSLVYGLTAGAAALFPQRNAQLASSVLSELKAIMPAEAVSGILARVADHMLRGAPAGDPDQPMEERLSEVVRYLTDKGFGATWEAENGRYVIHTSNCPYRGVAEQHPELCEMDHALIRRLVPGAVRLQLNSAVGPGRCSYAVPVGHRAVVDAEAQAQVS